MVLRELMGHYLNIGCGPRLFPLPWTNADILKDIGADIVMTIDDPWPFQCDTFDQIWADNVAEHASDAFHFIRELWRVSKPGAFIQLAVPIYCWAGFWEDPTHHSCWTPETFSWFLQGHPRHGAQPFHHIEFRLSQYLFRGSYELYWALYVVKPLIPDSAEAPQPIPSPPYFNRHIPK